MPEAEGDGATQMSVADLMERLDRGEDILVLDVRHDDDRERYTSRIMTTDWRDSFDVAGWADEMPKEKPVVVYCMYGFWVSQKAAQELRDHGVDARSLSGGHHILEGHGTAFVHHQNLMSAAKSKIRFVPRHSSM